MQAQWFLSLLFALTQKEAKKSSFAKVFLVPCNAL
jgi:hypothetical protein